MHDKKCIQFLEIRVDLFNLSQLPHITGNVLDIGLIL